MKESAGLLMFKRVEGALLVLLAHPGGPFFANRDGGAWGIPKGLLEPGEDPMTTARREFTEETSFPVHDPLIALGYVRQKGGKLVHAWAFEGDCDPGEIQSNTFELEWPRRSGRKQSFPEIDRASWFDLPAAREKMNEAQSAFLDRLTAALG